MTNLVKLREAQGLRQEDVAKILGVSRQAYCTYENDKRQAGYETLIKLADYFGVSVDYLLGKPQWTEEDKALGVGNHKTTLFPEEWEILETIEQLRQKKGDAAVKTVLQMIRIMCEK